MTGPAATIVRYVLVEARRSGLPWLAAACVMAALGLAGFLGQVAITESVALQATAAAALLRVCAVFLVVAHVVASVVRESNDKGLELALALPISRPAWYLGKLAGHALVGAAIAACFVLPLVPLAAARDLAAWGIALAAETALMAAAALFFASALGQTVSAIAATSAFYVLARALPSVQLIADSPAAGDGAGAGIARWTVDALALLLPRLEDVARADWLVYGAPSPAQLGNAMIGLGLYFLLLAAAGLFDLGRRNL